MNNYVDLMTVIPFGVDHQAVNVPRDWNLPIDLSH